MTNEDFANILRLARRAPLANMDEAEAVADLLQRFSAFALEHTKASRKKVANGYEGNKAGESESRKGST